jgi:hypothetical protein
MDALQEALLRSIDSQLISLNTKLEEQKETKLTVDSYKLKAMNKILKELQSFNKIRKVSNEKQLKMMTKVKDEVRDLGIVLGNKK